MDTLEKVKVQDAKLQLCFKKVLNFREACDYCGFSASHMYKLTSAKKIPHFCPNGKLLMFNREELEAWLQRNRQCTLEEIDDKVSSLTI